MTANNSISLLLLLGYALLQGGSPQSEPLMVETEVTRNEYLDVKLIAVGQHPLLLTLRQHVGAYLSIEIVDETGRPVRYGGEIAKTARAALEEFRLLERDTFFGTRISLRSQKGFLLEVGRAYECMVTYRNNDWSGWLSAKERQQLRRKWGEFDLLETVVRSKPLRIRLQ